MSKTFEGRPVTAKISDERINAPPSPPFLYMHHPNAWDCLDTGDGYELLPMLTQFQLVPGLNGVQMRAGGGIDATNAKNSFSDQGFVFIANDDTSTPGGYLREYDGRQGPVYTDKFTTPRKIGHGTFSKVIWDHDLEAFNTFRRGLISSGVVSNPDPSILEFQIALLDKRIARRVKSAHVPHIQKEVDAALSEKEALIEAKTTKKTTVKKKRAPKKAPAVK
tara:strand:+ start:55 stop:717 length:663 start_codon:yes stop_codon:yes gene_type:complete